MLIGGIVGFLVGLLLQSHGSLTTGMAALGIDSLHPVMLSLALTIFIAALCGVICAFLGELLDELFLQKH